MRKSILIVFILLVYSSCLFSQDNRYDINGLSFGIVPSALLNIWNGFQAEVNYGFADDFEISINLGVISNIRNSKEYSGYRIRPSIKYYFLKNNVLEKVYVELGYIKRVTNELRLENYNMFQGAFHQKVLNIRKKTVDGIFGMVGVREQIFSHFYIDGGFGIGLGCMNVKSDPIDNGQLITRFSFNPYNIEGQHFYPIAILHVALGFNF